MASLPSPISSDDAYHTCDEGLEEEKENFPPKSNGKEEEDSGDEGWTNVATNGSGEATEEEVELPYELTYEAFWDFCKNDEQRADLWEELKERGCHDLCDALRLFYTTLVVSHVAGNLRQRIAYTQATARRLTDSLQDLQPLAFRPRHPLPTTLIAGFTRQAGIIESLTACHRDDTLHFARVASDQRQGLFRLCKALNLEYFGTRTFHKYGYLLENMWNSGRPLNLPDPSKYEPEPYWHPDPNPPAVWSMDEPVYMDPFPDATKATPDRLNNTYIDPQAPDY
jgi:hypothetical protein